MSEQEKEVRLEGVVHASRYDPGAQGKQFLGVAIECSDGKVWVIDYEEQSPFHAFAGRHVVVSGKPYSPEGQHLIGWGGGKKLGHFRVSTMRLVEVTRDAEFVEVGAGQRLCGRFQLATRETGDSRLSFVTEEGNAFVVANDPAGATVGTSLEVWAYPVQPSLSIPTPSEQYLWIISPYSAKDLWEWRKRHS
jgi:hypothetical protein